MVLIKTSHHCVVQKLNQSSFRRAPVAAASAVQCALARCGRLARLCAPVRARLCARLCARASAVLCASHAQACERPSKQIQSTTNINNNKRSTKTKHKTTTKAQYKTIRRTLARLARSWRAPSPCAAPRVRGPSRSWRAHACSRAPCAALAPGARSVPTTSTTRVRARHSKKSITSYYH